MDVAENETEERELGDHLAGTTGDDVVIDHARAIPADARPEVRLQNLGGRADEAREPVRIARYRDEQPADERRQHGPDRGRDRTTAPPPAPEQVIDDATRAAEGERRAG